MNLIERDAIDPVDFFSTRIEDAVIFRDDFGKGKAGQRSYSLIVQGATCEVPECGKPAIGTTDVSSSGDLSMYPHCGPKHHQEIKEQIQTNLKYNIASIGINGFGRQ